MDIGKSFTFMFEDEDWITKYLIGCVFVLLSPVLIGIPFLFGYTVDLIRNVAEGESSPLPDWGDAGAKFVKGIIALLIGAIYMLPAILLGCIAAVVGVAASNGSNANAIVGLFIACINCLVALWTLLAAIVYPAGLTRYAVTGEFMAAFQFGRVFRYIGDHAGDYAVARVLTWITQFVAQIIGLIICLVGIIFTGFWSILVYGHMFGQVYRAGEAESTEVV